MCLAVAGRSAGAMLEQLHDDLRQEGRVVVAGRPRRRTELRVLSGIHGVPAAQLVGRPAAHQRVAGRGQLHPVGPHDRQTAQRLRGEHRSPGQAPQPDQRDGPIGRQQHARTDIAVSQNEYDQTHNVIIYRQVFALLTAQTFGKTEKLSDTNPHHKHYKL